MLSSELTKLPNWVTVAQKRLTQQPETVAGTVSSKEHHDPKFRGYGFAGECCEWIWEHPSSNDELWYWKKGDDLEDAAHNHDQLEDEGWKLYMKKRCAKHRRAIKRWQHAKKVFIRLDELRMNEGLEHLRFVTLTKKEWNQTYGTEEFDADKMKNHLKKRALRAFRNWRHRNQWWQSKNANGQYWPECVVTPVLNQIGSLEAVRLHFHLHCVIVSEYLDNRPGETWIETDQDGNEHIHNGDSEFFQEWGGIVDVRSVKNWQVKYTHKGEERRGCGRKACMKYLTKYISKADNWRSGKIGTW